MNSYMYVLGGTVCLAFFLVVYLLIFNPLPEQNQRVIDICIGFLGGQFVAIIQYFFGSSKSSADKTQIMAKNGKDSPEPPAGA